MAREPTYKVWEIQTQLYDTYGKPYVDLDVLSKRLEELHTPTEDDIAKNRGPALRNYAYIVHNRDRYTQEDEDEATAAIANGSQHKAVKAGELKPEHIHVELQLRDAKTISALTKWLSCPGMVVPEQWVVYVRQNAQGETETFDDKCAYLCHLRDPSKTPYRYDEVICTFNYEDMFKRYSVRKAKKGRSKASKAFIDEHVNNIANGTETVAGLIAQFGYAVYEQAKTKYDHAEQYFLRTHYAGAGLRLTYLVTGPSTTGKTPLAKLLACALFPDVTNPREVFFSVGDAGATFQGYRGQPVIIWDDWRAVDFISQFGREKVFSSLFQVHPSVEEFGIKYGTVMLRHNVNIITCVDNVDRFCHELAGEYVDQRGNMHKGEENQILQAYKRVWGFSEVTEQEIVCLFNQGYYRSDSAPDYYRQYEASLRLRNGTRAIVEHHQERLYAPLGSKIFAPVKDKYDELAQIEASKIGDVEQIDWASIDALRMPLDCPEIRKYPLSSDSAICQESSSSPPIASETKSPIAIEAKSREPNAAPDSDWDAGYWDQLEMSEPPEAPEDMWDLPEI